MDKMAQMQVSHIDISVVVPCYNAQAFVEKCLVSILKQKDVCFEVIAIDDASNDLTKHILRSLASENNCLNVHVLEENGGQAAARNLGLDQARGEFVAFLDSDDFYLHERALADWVERARRDGLDLCASDYMRLTRSGEMLPLPGLGIPADVVTSVRDCPQLSDISQCWQILYRRNFLDTHDLRFSRRLRQREDRLFFVSCLVRAEKVGNLGQALMAYRAHDGSTMAQVDRDQLDQFSLHMEFLTPELQAGHEHWNGLSGFETANATRYWRQSLGYWLPVIQDGVHKIWDEDADCEVYHLDDFVYSFFTRLQALTHRAGPVFAEDFSVRELESDENKTEGVLDIARLAVDVGDFEGLAQILLGERIHVSKLLIWARDSRFEWAKRAVARYLRFNRGWKFPENMPNKQTPPLSRLVKRVVLHIGMPKTGSSAMQEFLEVNRLPLLEQGIWYPDVGVERGRGVRSNRTAGHALLVQSMLRGEQEIGSLLAQQIKTLGCPVDTLFLSVENIFSDRFFKDNPRLNTVPELVFALVEALGVSDVEVWVGLRRQDKWFQSYYRELMANPFNKNLSSAVEFWDLLDRYGIFDYEAILRGIERLPRVSNVKVITVDEMYKIGGSIPWFLEGMGLQDTSAFQMEIPRVNESFSDAMALNIKLLKAFKVPRNVASQVFKNIIDSEALRNSRLALISTVEWQAFQLRFASELESYDRRYPGETAVSTLSEQDADFFQLEPSLLSVLPHGLLSSRKLERALSGDDSDDANLRQLLASCDDQIAHMKGELDYMKNSVSWRLTRPLRMVMRRWRMLQGR